MKVFKKIALITAFTAPFSFMLSAEASAHESVPSKSISIAQQSLNTIPSTAADDYQDDYEYTNETGYSNKAEEFIIVSVGVAMAVGSVMLLANSLDKKRRPDSIERVRLLQPQNSPTGPEDDPNFWPPKTYEN